MLFLSNDRSCFLIELADIYQSPEAQPNIVRENIEVLRKVLTWAETFLCNSHPLLGRTGAVCPYTEASMKNHYFWLTVCRGKDVSIEEVFNCVIKYRDWFLELDPRSGKEAQFKTILIVFPDIQVEAAPKIVDVVQRELKPEFVEKGVMIGQFHPFCQENGLWNAHFRPLQAPIPMLAIRHMVLTDFPFLKKEERFISSYIRVFGEAIPLGMREAIDEARRQLRIETPVY